MRSRQRPIDPTIQLNWKTKAYPTIRRFSFQNDIHVRAPRGISAPTQCASSATVRVVAAIANVGERPSPRLRKRIAAIDRASWQNLVEQLWCYCNTLKTFTQR